MLGGARFEHDWTNGPGHIRMVVLRTFRPQIKVILGVDSNVIIFINLSTAFVCIHVGKCPTFREFSISYISNMATN